MRWDLTGTVDFDPIKQEQLKKEGTVPAPANWDLTGTVDSPISPVVDAAIQRNPDELAEQMRVKKEADLQFVPNVPDLGKITRRMNYAQGRRRSGKITRELLADPATAALSADDIPSLVSVEDIAQGSGRAWMRTSQLIGAAVGDTAKGVMKIGEGAWKLAIDMASQVTGLPYAVEAYNREHPANRIDFEQIKRRVAMDDEWGFWQQMFTPPADWQPTGLAERVAKWVPETAMMIGRINWLTEMTGMGLGTALGLEGAATGMADQGQPGAIAGGVQGAMFGSILQNLHGIPAWAKIKQLRDWRILLAGEKQLQPFKNLPIPEMIGKIPLPLQMAGAATAFGAPTFFQTGDLEETAFSAAEGAMFHLMPTLRGLADIAAKSKLASRSPDAFANALRRNMEAGLFPQTGFIEPGALIKAIPDEFTRQLFLEGLDIPVSYWQSAMQFGHDIPVDLPKLIANSRHFRNPDAIWESVRAGAYDRAADADAVEVTGKEPATPSDEAVTETPEQPVEQGQPLPEPIAEILNQRQEILTSGEHHARLVEGLRGAGYTKLQAEAMAAPMMGHARWYAEQTGQTPADYFDEIGLDVRKGEEPKPQRPLEGFRTLSGFIRMQGYIDPGNFAAKVKDLSPAARRLFRKGGAMAVDHAADALVSEGFMREGEDLLELLRDPVNSNEFLRRNKPGQDLFNKRRSEMSEREKAIVDNADEPNIGNVRSLQPEDIPREGEFYALDPETKRVERMEFVEEEPWGVTVRAGGREFTVSEARPLDVLFQMAEIAPGTPPEKAAEQLGLTYKGEWPDEPGLHLFDDTANGLTFSVKDLTQLPQVLAGQRAKGASKLFQSKITKRGMSEFFPDGKVRVTMFKAKNLSTFLHESGHIFLKDMETISASGKGTEQFQKDWRTVREWLGAEDGKEFTTEQHEQFAKGLEAYFMEGKAPTPQLNGAFRRFRSWLVKIYESVKRMGLANDMNDDMRRVFDRMLGTEAEIDAGRKWMEIKPYWADKPAPMTDAEWVEYKNAIGKADEAAAVAIMNRREKEQARLVGRWEKLAKEYAANSPETALANQVRDAGGIAYADLKDRYPDIAKAIYDMHPALFRGGDARVTLEDMAQRLEFTDADELVSSLQVMRPRQQIERDYVDELRSEHDKNAPADDLVLTDAYETLLAREAEILAKLAGEQGYRPLQSHQVKRHVRQIANIAVDELPAVSEMDALKGALQMASRDSKRAERAGRMDEALRQKEKQQALVAKLREQQRIRKQIEKDRGNLRKIAGRVRRTKKIEKANRIAWEAREQLRSLLGRFEIPVSEVQRPKELQPLREWFESQSTEMGEQYLLPEWLSDPMRPNQRFTKLTPDELRELTITAKMIEHLGRTHNQLLRTDKRQAIEDAADILWKKASELPVKHKAETFTGPAFDSRGEVIFDDRGVPQFREYPKIDRKEPTLRERLAKGYDWHGLVKPEFIFRRLDGFKGDTSGPWYDYFVRPFAQSETAMLETWEKINPRLQKLFELYSPKELKALRREKFDLGLPHGPLTREQLIATALNMGNEGNLKALVQGRGYRAEHLEAIRNALTERDWKFIQGVWRTIDSLFNELDSVHRRMTGSPLERVEPITVETPSGPIMGGYYPLVWDRKVSSLGKDFSDADIERFYFENTWRLPVTRRGFTIARVGGTLPPRLDLGVIYEHLHDTIHHMTHAVAIRDADRLLASPKVKAAIESRLGPAYYEQMRPWLQYMARPRAEYLNNFERSVDALRRNTTVAILGLKATVALKQFGSYTQTIDAVGFGRATKALWTSAVGRGKVADFIKERSAYMRARGTNLDRELADTLNRMDVNVPSIVVGNRSISGREVGDALFYLIRTMDKMATYPTWMAGYSEGIEKYDGDQKLAAEHADMIVRTTQPSSMAKDLAAWQRGGVLKKIVTPFYTFFSVFANRYLEKHAAFQAGKIGAGELLISYWWLVVAPALYAQFATDLNVPTKKDEIARYIAAIPKMLAAGFPVMRDVATPLVDYLMTGDYFPPGLPVQDLVDSVVDLGTKSIRAAKKAAAGKPMGAEDAWQIGKKALDVAGYAYGLPSKQMITTLEGAGQLASGETKNPTVLFFREKRAKKQARFNAANY